MFCCSACARKLLKLSLAADDDDDDNEDMFCGKALLFDVAGLGFGTDVTVMVKGFCWCDCDELTGADVGVTVTLGVTGCFLGELVSGNRDCSLAADKPRTISSSLRRFFSLPTTGSSTG